MFPIFSREKWIIERNLVKPWSEFIQFTGNGVLNCEDGSDELDPDGLEPDPSEPFVVLDCP